jgi:hypothetical protein
MKKNILVFGLISGVIVSSMMIYSTLACYNDPDFESNMVLGYAAMIVAFSFIFVGVKNFRDKYNNGVISFGKAFKIGLYITLIASTIYVGVWLVDYYLFLPDFIDKYSAHVIKEAQESGATASEISSKTTDMKELKEMYKNPLLVILITYTEIVPIGVVVSLIAAAILKRKQYQIAV